MLNFDSVEDSAISSNQVFRRNCMSRKVRLSQSSCFVDIKNEFSSMELDDWASVPHAITNSVIYAKSAAEQAMKLVADLVIHDSEWIHNNKLCFFDIGSGIGRFSYYFLKHLNQLLLDSVYRSLVIQYVLCDVSDANIGLCESHPRLQHFIQLGQLKTFCGTHHELLGSMDDFYEKGDVPFFIANYFLDVLPQDAYQWKDGAWFEVLINQVGMADRYSPTKFSDSLSYRPLEFPVYEDKIVDQLLQDVIAESKSYDRFLWPVGAMSFFSSLTKRFDFFAYLVADYGYCDKEENRYLDESFLVSNYGAYSFFPVQFDFMQRYLNKLGGYMVIPSNREVLIQCGGVVTKSDSSLCFYKAGLKEYANQLWASNLLSLARALKYDGTPTSRNAILACLQASACDPSYYFKLLVPVGEFHDKLTESQKAVFASRLYRVVENLYCIGSDDVNKYEILVKSLILIGSYEHALEMIDEGLHLCGRPIELYFLKGRVYFLTECFLDAIEWFDRCIQGDFCTQESGSLRQRCMDRLL